MANPPFNVNLVDAERIKNAPPLLFCLPWVNKDKRVSNGNFLWISSFWSYLKPTGRAGFVMSSQASSAGNDEKTVRQKLVETGDVDVMISIKGGFFYTRTVPCQLWHFDRNKPAASMRTKPKPSAKTSTVFTASRNSAANWPNSTSSKPSPCAPPPPSRKPRKKNLQSQCLAEKYRETEHFLAQARQKLAQKLHQQNLTQWFETDLRDALAHDAPRMIEDLFNDRQLIPTTPPPLPGETVHHNRPIPIPIHTLFGTVTLKRRYFHHANSHSGRAPLDLILDLTEHHTPAVAKLICQASTNAGDSYQEASDIFTVFTGLKLEARSFHRLINRLTPELTEALPTLPASADTKPIPILYNENDGTGVPSRAEELAGRKGKQPDGSARTREAKLGCVFTQTTTDDEGKPLRGPPPTSPPTSSAPATATSAAKDTS